MFVATFRVQFLADDEVGAALLADQMAQELATDLNPEDGEEAALTQVASTSIGATPEELLVNFRATRNALIRTRFKPAFDLAKQLQEIIQALQEGDLQLMRPFRHGDFADLAEAILVRNENPQ